MIALTLTAHLAQPAAIAHPPMLDALLYVGLHRALTIRDPRRWPGPAPLPEIYDLPLPLARVETSAGWWWAASQATPTGPESVRYEHRRPPVEAYGVYQIPEKGRLPKVDLKAGDDKALRVSVYTRPGWWRPQWTCVVDPAPPTQLAELLGWEGIGAVDLVTRLFLLVPSIGRRSAAGHGVIDHRTVEPGGPPLEDYATDVALRHLPLSLQARLPTVGRVVRVEVPLRPPYYGKRDLVPCAKVRP